MLAVELLTVSGHRDDVKGSSHPLTDIRLVTDSFISYSA